MSSVCVAIGSAAGPRVLGATGLLATSVFTGILGFCATAALVDKEIGTVSGRTSVLSV